MTSAEVVALTECYCHVDAVGVKEEEEGRVFWLRAATCCPLSSSLFTNDGNGIMLLPVGLLVGVYALPNFC